jgi:SpoVK/Ycf46/Vps4 family AAA+-type ATPase
MLCSYHFCFVEQIHTSKMTLADDVNLEEFIMSKDEFSGADIKAICTEAGLLALRERRMKVRHCNPHDPLFFFPFELIMSCSTTEKAYILWAQFVDTVTLLYLHY